jgi:TATA-box binding protein (TBP) (component of TFIID and TFIIIB)
MAYKVSTITVTGSIGSEIDLQALLENVRIVGKNGTEKGVIYVEKCTAGKLRSRGEVAKEKKRSPQKEHVRFENQTTLIVKIFDDILYFANAKCFRNGNVQITGIKDEGDGPRCIQIIADSVRDNGIAKASDKLGVYNHMIRLINSDFKVPFCIDNYALQDVMIKNYENISIYEKCIYPGVKIVYYYNEHSPVKDGICCCASFCRGTACKKITVAVFQSGSVIITGGVNRVQIDEVHAFVVRALTSHRGEIETLRPAAKERRPQARDILDFFRATRPHHPA